MKLLKAPSSGEGTYVLGSQPTFGRVRVGIMRALEEDGTAHASLLVRGPGVVELVRLEIGDTFEIAGEGVLRLDAVGPATREVRGWVKLSFEGVWA